MRGLVMGFWNSASTRENLSPGLDPEIGKHSVQFAATVMNGWIPAATQAVEVNVSWSVSLIVRLRGMHDGFAHPLWFETIERYWLFGARGLTWENDLSPPFLS